MSSYNTPCILGFDAEGDLSDKQFHLVEFGSSEKQVVLTGDAEKAFGVLMSKGSGDGDEAEVAVSGGGAKVKASATITRGQSIASDANGQARPAVSGEWAVGIAMEDAAAGDIIGIQVDIHQLA